MTRDELLDAYAEGRRNFICANLAEADLQGAILLGANLQDADLRGANLRCANLEGANLLGANLRGANLAEADLQGANLLGANLRNANLFDANLRNANLEGANLRGANLVDANLEDANLAGANLWGAILLGAIGNMKEIKSMQLDRWTVAYTFDRIQIGCKNHSIEEWRGFGDEAIASMSIGSLGWWRKWKNHLFKTIELSPATPTGHEVSIKYDGKE